MGNFSGVLRRGPGEGSDTHGERSRWPGEPHVTPAGSCILLAPQPAQPSLQPSLPNRAGPHRFQRMWTGREQKSGLRSHGSKRCRQGPWVDVQVSGREAAGCVCGLKVTHK